MLRYNVHVDYTIQVNNIVCHHTVVVITLET